MPDETQTAIEWALTQTYKDGDNDTAVTLDNHGAVVDKVRAYFNAHGIEYSTFSWADLKPYLPSQ